MKNNVILKNEEIITIGSKLKELREMKGYTQEALGNKLGVKKQTISNWEKENVMPAMEHIINMAEIYNCSIDYLLNSDEEYKVNTVGLNNEQIFILSSLAKEFKRINKLEKELNSNKDINIISK